MDAIERILQTITPADQLKQNTALAHWRSLSRTLRDIAALNRPDDETPRDDTANTNDPVPGDIDEFRRELARRITGLLEAERGDESESAGEGWTPPLD